MAWKKTHGSPLVDLVGSLGTLQQKLLELKAKQLARRALLQGRALQASATRRQRRIDEHAPKGGVR